MLERCLRLGRLCAFSPAQAARAARRPESLLPGLLIYLAFLLAYVLFFSWKPFDFPIAQAPLPDEPQGLFHWAKVAVWQPPLELAWIVMLGGLLAWLKEGSLPLRVVLGAGWWAGLLILVVAYAQLGGISKAGFAAGAALAYALFFPLVRRLPKEDWRPLAAFMLALNAIGLLLFLPMAAAVALGSERLYQAAQIVGGFWVLGAGTLGLRELAGLRLPRALMALLLSLFFQVCLPFVLYLLGLVPREILKALFYG